MKTLGLDLSLVSTGVCLLDGKNEPFLKTISSKPSGDSYIAELRRIKNIVREIEDILMDNYDIDIIAIEGLAFMAKNTTSLMQLAGLSYMVRNMLDDYGKRFLVIAPSSLKKFITSKGNATKDIMMLETFKRYDISILDNNQCDAFGLAKCASYYKKKNLSDLTKEQKEVIELLNKQI